MYSKSDTPAEPYLTALTIGLLSLAYLVMGLAPGVTAEDSGELVTAACRLGIAHPPGYPLFTLFGYLFCQLPFASSAYSINLMSAVFSSLAAAVLFLTSHRILVSFRSPTSQLLSIAVAFAFVSLPDVYRQSVITEVYGLTNFILAMLMYLTVKSFSEKKTLPWLFFFCGLAICTHHICWYMVVLALGLTLFSHLRQIHWFSAIFSLCLGLLPYIYLPIRAMQSPVLNWGNPSNWADFVRVVTRGQYAKPLLRPMVQLNEQLREQVIFIFQQLSFPLVFIGIFGLVFAISHKRISRLTFLLLTGLVLSGPTSAWLINFGIPIGASFQYEQASKMYSVFFSGHYMFWLIAIALGIHFLLSQVKKPWHQTALICGLFVLIGMRMVQTHKIESMVDYNVLEMMIAEWKETIPGPAIIVTKWDPFSFPLMYFKYVSDPEGFREIVLVDIEMLKAPWYLKATMAQLPAIAQELEQEIQQYSAMATKLERGGEADPKVFFQTFNKLVTDILQQGLKSHKVFVAHFDGQVPLNPAIFSNFEHSYHPTIRQLGPKGEDPSFANHKFDDKLQWFPSSPKRRLERMYMSYLAWHHLQYAKILEGEESRRYSNAAIQLAAGYPDFQKRLEEEVSKMER